MRMADNSAKPEAPRTAQVVFLIERTLLCGVGQPDSTTESRVIGALKLCVLRLLEHLSENAGYATLRWGYMFYKLNTVPGRLHPKQFLWKDHSLANFERFENDLESTLEREPCVVQQRIPVNSCRPSGATSSGGKHLDGEDRPPVYYYANALRTVLADFHWDGPDLSSPVKPSPRIRGSAESDVDNFVFNFLTVPRRGRETSDFFANIVQVTGDAAVDADRLITTILPGRCAAEWRDKRKMRMAMIDCSFLSHLDRDSASLWNAALKKLGGGCVVSVHLLVPCLAPRDLALLGRAVGTAAFTIGWFIQCVSARTSRYLLEDRARGNERTCRGNLSVAERGSSEMLPISTVKLSSAASYSLNNLKSCKMIIRGTLRKSAVHRAVLADGFSCLCEPEGDTLEVHRFASLMSSVLDCKSVLVLDWISADGVLQAVCVLEPLSLLCANLVVLSKDLDLPSTRFQDHFKNLISREVSSATEDVHFDGMAGVEKHCCHGGTHVAACSLLSQKIPSLVAAEDGVCKPAGAKMTTRPVKANSLIRKAVCRHSQEKCIASQLLRSSSPDLPDVEALTSVHPRIARSASMQQLVADVTPAIHGGASSAIDSVADDNEDSEIATVASSHSETAAARARLLRLKVPRRERTCHSRSLRIMTRSLTGERRSGGSTDSMQSAVDTSASDGVRKVELTTIAGVDFTSEEELLKHATLCYDKAVIGECDALMTAQSIVAVVRHFYEKQGAEQNAGKAFVEKYLYVTKSDLRKRHAAGSEQRERECQLQIVLRLETEARFPHDLLPSDGKSAVPGRSDEESAESVSEQVCSLLTTLYVGRPDEQQAYLDDVLSRGYADDCRMIIIDIYTQLGRRLPPQLQTSSVSYESVQSAPRSEDSGPAWSKRLLNVRSQSETIDKRDRKHKDKRQIYVPAELFRRPPPKVSRGQAAGERLVADGHRGASKPKGRDGAKRSLFSQSPARRSLRGSCQSSSGTDGTRRKCGITVPETPMHKMRQLEQLQRSTSAGASSSSCAVTSDVTVIDESPLKDADNVSGSLGCAALGDLTTTFTDRTHQFQTVPKGSFYSQSTDDKALEKFRMLEARMAGQSSVFGPPATPRRLTKSIFREALSSPPVAVGVAIGKDGCSDSSSTAVTGQSTIDGSRSYPTVTTAVSSCDSSTATARVPDQRPTVPAFSCRGPTKLSSKKRLFTSPIRDASKSPSVKDSKLSPVASAMAGEIYPEKRPREESGRRSMSLTSHAPRRTRLFQAAAASGGPEKPSAWPSIAASENASSTDGGLAVGVLSPGLDNSCDVLPSHGGEAGSTSSTSADHLATAQRIVVDRNGSLRPTSKYSPDVSANSLNQLLRSSLLTVASPVVSVLAKRSNTTSAASDCSHAPAAVAVQSASPASTARRGVTDRNT